VCLCACVCACMCVLARTYAYEWDLRGSKKEKINRKHRRRVSGYRFRKFDVPRDEAGNTWVSIHIYIIYICIVFYDIVYNTTAATPSSLNRYLYLSFELYWYYTIQLYKLLDDNSLNFENTTKLGFFSLQIIWGFNSAIIRYGFSGVIKTWCWRGI